MRTALISAVLLALAWPSAVVPAAVAPHGTVSAPPSARGPADGTELETFLDGVFTNDMAERHIAGAAIAVVKDGRLLFTKGYGYADVEKKTPFDPDRTGLITGSVGKLFTWTAVMQLVEQGKLDLDADINTYLDFRIPDTYPQAITLKNLLTHTDGFEERFYEYLVLKPEDSAPVREWLVSHMPARVRPPGTVAAYSNYGASLAGYIVARVSGQPYDEYLAKHIFEPLGMRRTTATLPYPPELLASVGASYTYANGSFKAFPDVWPQLATAPAGTQLSTVTDMARFMLAHLQNGRYSGSDTGEVRILGESTARQMHQNLFTHDRRLLGTAYGFFDFTDNGRRTIGHSGEAAAFNTVLLLLPEENLGVFVAYNSEGGNALTLQHLGFQRAFFDHYYPAPSVKPVQPAPDFGQRAARFTGSYRSTRSSYTTLEKVKNLMGGVEVSDNGDGTVLLTTPWTVRRFVEVEPDYFRQVDGPYGMVFQQDGQGRVTRLFTDFTPMMAFEKVAWYETVPFSIGLLVTCVVVFLSTIPVGVRRFLLNRRRRRDEQQPDPRPARVAQGVIVAISVLNLLFVVGTFLWGNPAPLFGVSLIYQVVLGLAVVAAVLTIAALLYAVLAWANRYWGVATRAHYTLASVAAAGFVWFLNDWNLLGWHF